MMGSNLAQVSLYAFRADDGPLIDRAFGMAPFATREEAERAGSKFWAYSLVFYRRGERGEWVHDG